MFFILWAAVMVRAWLLCFGRNLGQVGTKGYYRGCAGTVVARDRGGGDHPSMSRVGGM